MGGAPWLRGGVAFTAGVAVAVGPGAHAAARHVALLWILLALALVALVGGTGTRDPLRGEPAASRFRGGPARRLRGRGVPALAALLLAGLVAGGHASRRSLASCTPLLRAGDTLRARGLLVSGGPVPAARKGPGGAASRPGAGRRAGAARHRGILADVELRRGRLRCRADRLVVRVRRGTGRPEPGSPVVVRGTWWEVPGARGRVRAPSRYGVLSGWIHAAPGSAERGRRPAISRLVAAVDRRLRRRLPPDVAPVVRAFLLARRDELPAGTYRRFADAGLAHLLAVSGLHVGLLAAVVLAVAGRLWPDRRRYPAAAAGVAGYVVAIGAPAAAVRAGLLFGGWAACRWRGAPASAGDLLGAAAAAMLLVRPVAIVEPGFQLSFAGFTGLAVGDALVRRLAGSDAPAFARAAGAAVGAFLCTEPLTAYHFQRAAPVAVVANFVGTPLLAAVLYAAVGVLLLPGVLAPVAAHAASGAVRTLLAAVELLGRLPFGHGPAEPPGATYWAAAGLVAWGVAACLRTGRVRRAVLPLAGAAALSVAAPAMAGWTHRGHTLWCALDVGQGDAAVMRTRRGHWIVVDAGPGPRAGSAGLRRVVPFLRARGARAVSLFVLTHPHGDHMGGAVALFRAFRVRAVLDAAVAHPGRSYGRFLDAVDAEGARWLPARDGDRFRVDEVEGLVLAPSSARAEGTTWPYLPGPNETSVVLRLRVRDAPFAVLMAGDAGAEQESAVLGRWPADSLAADVLKVGHHGSRHSTTSAWLEAVRPRAAVISAGRGNRYGHPHPEVLARLRAAEVERVARTDANGSVCLRVDRSGAWRLDAGAGPG